MAVNREYLGNMRGPQGYSVETAVIGGDDHLKLWLSDGSVLDAGVARGAQGLPGTNAVPADSAVGGYIDTTGTSDTKTALQSLYGQGKAFLGTTGDQTTALQAFLDSLVTGDVATIVGTVQFSTVTISGNDVHIRLAPGAVLNKTSAATDGIVVAGARVTIEGGTIVSPATFDGTNVQPTYAVVHTTGDGAKFRNVTLTNVPKVGIYFDDVDTGLVEGCHVVGNYPAGSWTGVETGHFGIAVNPTASGKSGRIRVIGNLIQSCVQGLFLGNYGPTSTGSYGAVISGNTFDGCLNHGIYNAGGVDACAVTGNTFTRCSLPIALTGNGHAVTGNTLYTHATGNNLDLVGISLREPVGCTITGNTVKGDAPANAVIIDLGNYVAGSTFIGGNVVSGNTIDVAGGTATGIRLATAQTATCVNNIIANNVVASIGRVGLGIISVTAPTGAVAYGNKITGNDIIVRGESNGIYVANTSHITVQSNSVRFEYNAPSAKTLAGVLLTAALRSIVTGNDFYNGSGFGTNVTIRGVWEAAGCLNGKYGPNGHDGTGAAAYTPLVTVASTECLVDDSGAGAPNGAIFAAIGSRWARTDGGAATSLYVKETNSASASGWVAK